MLTIFKCKKRQTISFCNFRFIFRTTNLYIFWIEKILVVAFKRRCTVPRPLLVLGFLNIQHPVAVCCCCCSHSHYISRNFNTFIVAWTMIKLHVAARIIYYATNRPEGKPKCLNKYGTDWEMGLSLLHSFVIRPHKTHKCRL